VAGSGGGPSIPAGLRYYHADGLGSTRLLTDDTAAVTDQLTYEAFGEVDAAASVQSSDNAFLYTGEQFDLNAGFYYLRARYMSPALGRFAQQDTFAGLSGDTITLHKYLYASAGPTNGRDPSGNVTLSEMSAVNNIRSELTQMQVDAGFGVYKREVLGTDEELNPIQTMYVTLLDAGAEVQQFLFRSPCDFCVLAVKGRFPLTFNRVRRGWGRRRSCFTPDVILTQILEAEFSMFLLTSSQSAENQITRFLPFQGEMY
jgi:RHS repeat-associated protein